MTDRPLTLADALAHYQIALPADQVSSLERYCQFLWQWNQRMNLTRHTDFQKFVARDLIDTLQLSRQLRAGEEVLDVGTGGGVPGVVLAVLRPDLKIVLCESIGKKAQAVQAIVEELDLPVPVYAERAEVVVDDFRFDALVARAVGPLAKICRWFEPHWQMIGRILVIKGPNWTAERAEAESTQALRNVGLKLVASYPMPETTSESVILKLWPKDAPEPA